MLLVQLACSTNCVRWKGTRILGSGSTIQNFYLRLHSPAWNQLLLEMNNIVPTNAFAFILFVRSFY